MIYKVNTCTCTSLDIFPHCTTTGYNLKLTRNEKQLICKTLMLIRYMYIYSTPYTM